MHIAIGDANQVRSRLCQDTIASLGQCGLLWVAHGAEETVKKASMSQPDLLLLSTDIASVCMDRIMVANPCAILLIASTGDGNSSIVFEAMGRGALDVIELDLQSLITRQAGMEKLSAKIAMIKLLIGLNNPQDKKKGVDMMTRKLFERQRPPLLVVGASTGGPRALEILFSAFHSPCPFAAIVVQHVDPAFAEGLAVWLQKQTGLLVEPVVAGRRPQVGKVLIACSNDHLIMHPNGELHYTPYPEDKTYRPSVDVFFQSVASCWKEVGIAALLTGMGSDGALGLKLLAASGWHTIAEHEESCVVFGMPRAAIEMGAAAEVLPIDEIGPAISQKLQVMS